MKKVGIYPGSFDPFTKGHENIVEKALTIFDEMIIGIGFNTSKKTYFTLDSRLKHMESIYKNNPNIKVITYDKLTVEFCKENNARFIIRGLRNSKDFEYELPILHTNKLLDNHIETVFFVSDLSTSFIESTIIREVHKNGKVIADFVTNSEILVIE